MKTADKAILGACRKADITREQFFSKTRNQMVVRARMLASVLLREQGYSFPQIGKELNLDHTTIIHAVKNAYKYAIIKQWGDEIRNAPEARGAYHLAPQVRQMSAGRYANIYQLYGYKCAICGFDEVIEIHHIIPVREGGSTTPDNIIVLCPNHHALADRGMVQMKDIPKQFELSSH